MTLQELNNKIHSIATPTELSTELSSLKSDIKSAINAGGSFAKNYFENHTGRELFRKLSSFGLVADILDEYDSGFRPISVDRWDPLSINTCAWYDSSDSSSIVQDSNVISKWLDKSKNNNHLTSLNFTNLFDTSLNSHAVQKNELNGLDTLSLSLNDFFQKTDVLLSTESGNIQVFVVTKVTEVTTSGSSILSLEESTGAENNVDFQMQSGGSTEYRARVNAKNAAGNNLDVHTKISTSNYTNQWSIFSAIFDIDNSKFSSNVNGEIVGVEQPYTKKITGGNLTPPTELKIFANRGTNSAHLTAGSVAEILYCENSSTIIKKRIEGYLAHKWGLTSLLDAAHPYKDLPYKSINS